MAINTQKFLPSAKGGALSKVNNNIINAVVDNHYLMDLNLHHDDVFSLSITYDGNTQNLIHLYNNISHNKIIITDIEDCDNL